MPADACPQKVQKLLQRNYKKAIAKQFQKSYNMVTARASGPAECEIFFFLFLGISGTGFSSSDCSPSQFVILRAAQAVSRFVCKKARPFRDELFCIFCRPEKAKNRLPMRKSMTLRNFCWAFCLFFCKGHLQSLAGRGFVFRRALWYSIYNQFISNKHESD